MNRALPLTEIILVTLNACRAKNFREALKRKYDVECGLAMIIKQRAKANDIEKMDLVGSVQDCDAIIGNCSNCYRIIAR